MIDTRPGHDLTIEQLFDALQERITSTLFVGPSPTLNIRTRKLTPYQPQQTC